MKTKITLLVSILAALLLSPLALAEENPTRTIASIMADLNHFPSDEEKQQLQTIGNNSANSAATRTIALALAAMEHKVKPTHKKQLQGITESDKATDAEKTLANVLMEINHKPSAEAVEKLKKL